MATLANSFPRVAPLLQHVLERQLSPEALSWLNTQCAHIASGDARVLNLSFGFVPRKLGKAELEPTAAEVAQAAEARPGWSLYGWSTDEAARIRLLLAYPSEDAAAYLTMLDRLFATSDVRESVTLYQALPVYPHQDRLSARAAEGIRSNIRSVFTAVAHRNPFPAERLSDEAWNQMILKCLFVGAHLDPVVGLEQRANAPLAQMLCDFAKERRAAHRSVSPELWRCVGPFADAPALELMQHAVRGGTPLDRAAVALSLASNPLPEAQAMCRQIGGAAPATWSQLVAEMDNV